MSFTDRTRMLIGDSGISVLKNARVAVFGIGGVGSYAAEALVRSGVGYVMVVDSDAVSQSNLNRQLIALSSTVGMDKCEVFAMRAKDICADTVIEQRKQFVLQDNIDTFDLAGFDYVIDAVDTVAAKVAIIKKCKQEGVPVISCMGTGNKLRPEMLELTDIYKTSGCPLARAMRTRLKKEGIASLKVVFSTEEPIKTGERVPGSMAFVPGAAGLIAASAAVRDILERAQDKKTSEK